MATAKMHFQAPRRRRDAGQNREAALRVVQVGRSGEVLPVLMQEIVALSYPRAVVVESHPESGEIVPVTTLNWPSPQLEKLTEALRASDGMFAGVLAGRTSVYQATIYDHPLSLHPMTFSNANPCWEVLDGNGDGCLAVQDLYAQKSNAQKQPSCSICGMRGYAAVAVVE